MAEHLEQPARTALLPVLSERPQDSSVESLPNLSECLNDFDEKLIESPLFEADPIIGLRLNDSCSPEVARAQYDHFKRVEQIVAGALLVRTAIKIEDDPQASYLAQKSTRIITNYGGYTPDDAEKVQSYVTEILELIDERFHFSQELVELPEQSEQLATPGASEIVDFTDVSYWENRFSKLSVFTVNASESGDPEAVAEDLKIKNKSERIAALFVNDEIENDSDPEIQDFEVSLKFDHDTNWRYATRDAVSERFDYIEEKSCTYKSYKKVWKWLTTNEDGQTTEPSLENLEFNIQGKNEELFLRQSYDDKADKILEQLVRSPGLLRSFSERSPSVLDFEVTYEEIGNEQ